MEVKYYCAIILLIRILVLKNIAYSCEVSSRFVRIVVFENLTYLTQRLIIMVRLCEKTTRKNDDNNHRIIVLGRIFCTGRFVSL